ncbi:hypothetical protein H0H93_014126 [Arthromyces matolae]|nr:hypothetical protein H0H93_014126 [Arthromyces matolae]
MDQADHIPETVSSLPRDSDTWTMLSELSLPEWATKTDVAAPLEALSAFDAEAGRVQFAIPHYLQAISVLVPRAPKTSTDEERCRGIRQPNGLGEQRRQGTVDKSSDVFELCMRNVGVLKESQRAIYKRTFDG